MEINDFIFEFKVITMLNHIFDVFNENLRANFALSIFIKFNNEN